MAGCTDAGSAVHRQAGIATVDRRGLAGVDADPHLHLAVLGPRVAGQRSLCLDRRKHGFMGTSERVEEGIALRVDLVPAVVRKRLTKESLMLAQHIRIASTQLSDEPCRSLDIREEKRHGAARKICHRMKACHRLGSCARGSREGDTA
jgi:hypothetical protein